MRSTISCRPSNTSNHLESVQQIGLSELNSLISSAKVTSVGLLDPIPTKILKEVTPVIIVPCLQ